MFQVCIAVTGQVQGIGFRYFALQRAKALGLVGIVRNMQDGSVEAIAQGEKQALEQFAEELRQGPSMGSVKEIRINWQKPGQRFEGFEIGASH